MRKYVSPKRRPPRFGFLVQKIEIMTRLVTPILNVIDEMNLLARNLKYPHASEIVNPYVPAGDQALTRRSTGTVVTRFWFCNAFIASV